MDMERTILEQLRRRLPQYELCEGNREHLRDIYRLITGNEEFLKSTQAHEQTMEECEEALVTRPPQVTAENKHFLVIYENGECVHISDFSSWMHQSMETESGAESTTHLCGRRSAAGIGT